jgi:hypothetical protein
MKCEGCGQDFYPKASRGRFCGSRCRTDAWVRRKQREARAPLEQALRRVAGLLEEAQEEIRGAVRGERHLRTKERHASEVRPCGPARAPQAAGRSPSNSTKEEAEKRRQ